ncbi:hypothetical protein RF679_01090 [Undibacterium cyanobacteriorum]|uniref:Immunity protein 63 domain-containing protein n=1 Tax=Undibacterium cyanobacteriorum TaxID=3073561 RepID=A0ABY9RLL6_9BURK|nr:hypothetical protein [Undibacterium sp. 20NA77.5]WMW80891.1 hypothetical protein RF679_01090 [Undibacterium sp. 20NA77.5]
MAFQLERVSQARANELMKLANTTVYQFAAKVLIDYDRDLVLLCLGGKGDQPAERNEPPNYWCLLYRGNSVKFTSHSRFEFIDGLDVACEDLREFRVPNSFQEKLPEIQDAIKEAFASFYSEVYERTVLARVKFPVAVFY